MLLLCSRTFNAALSPSANSPVFSPTSKARHALLPTELSNPPTCASSGKKREADLKETRNGCSGSYGYPTPPTTIDS